MYLERAYPAFLTTLVVLVSCKGLGSQTTPTLSKLVLYRFKMCTIKKRINAVEKPCSNNENHCNQKRIHKGAAKMTR